MSKGKNFTGTKNNPKETPEEFLEVLKRLDAVCARVQLEKGEEGTPHLQWMVSLKREARHSKIVKQLPGCHVEVAKNAMASWNYCGKQDTRLQGPFEFGVPPASKAVKGDTAARNRLIIEYGSVKAVEDGLVPIEKMKSLQQSLELFKVMKKEVKDLDVLDNEWHWGYTGTGKSRGVRARFPDAFIKSNDYWWDGYNGEDVVIIEEMGPQQIGVHHFQKWCDHYSFKANIKGSAALIRPRKIIVTSNYSISECWPDIKNDVLESLLRRFKVHHYPKPLAG